MLEKIGSNIKFAGVDSNSVAIKPTGNRDYSGTSVAVQQPDAFVKQNDGENKKKLSTNAKIGIVAGILTVAGIVTAAILTKGKTLKPANFAEHIEFKPAQNMEDAVAYAKKNFGVENFDFGDDVEMANWVNEGLTNINNRFKGKANMPKELRWENAEEIKELPKAIGLCNGDKASVKFNKDYINSAIANFKKEVEETLKPYYENDIIHASFHLGADRDTHKKVLELYNKLSKTPEKVSRFDALNGHLLMEDYAESLVYFNKNKLSIFKNKILNNEDAIKILKNHNLSTDIKDYESLPQDELNKKISDVIELVFNKVPIINTSTMRGSSKFGVLYHEIGHYLHAMNTSLKDKMWGKLSQKAEKSFIASEEKQNIAGKVSSYGRTNQKEFVAECFQALCAGKKLPDDVMKMYREYRGPELPNM